MGGLRLGLLTFGITEAFSYGLVTPPAHPHPTDGSASPQGEAGAKRRQGTAKRLPRQGGLRVGVGGWCN